MAPACNGAALPPRAWRSCPPASSAPRSAPMRCCPPSRSRCSPAPRRPACTRPADPRSMVGAWPRGRRRGGRVAWCLECRARGAAQVRRLGPNAFGEQLQPGRVADCYLGILLEQPLAEIAPEPGRVLVVAPAGLLHREIPQPHGQVLYDLLTGHPDRAPRDLVFLADLTVELRAWPQQTWTAVGVSPEAALLVVVDCWRAGRIKGLEVGGLSVEEARALGRPAMTYVREQLRGRLAREVSRQYLRWLHPTSRRPGESFL